MDRDEQLRLILEQSNEKTALLNALVQSLEVLTAEIQALREILRS